MQHPKLLATSTSYPIYTYKDFSPQEPQHSPSNGQPAVDALYRLDKIVIVRLGIVAAYLVLSAGLLIWALRGPLTQDGRVLSTGKLPVDQFYSGLALSTLLAPCAIVTRMLSSDMQMLHPLSIAASQRIAMGDLDRMTDLGFFASLGTIKYSTWCALVQIFTMLVGAGIVPLGTLIITTGRYSAATRNSAVVGMPTTNDFYMHSLAEYMGYNGTSPFQPSFDTSDLFLNMTTDTLCGATIGRTTPLRLYPGTLGPIETVNITFTPEAQYNGIVTFDWAGNCQRASEKDIHYDIVKTDRGEYINVTFPDGHFDGTILGQKPILGWIVTDNWSASGFPIGGTHYLVQASNKNLTSSVPLLSNDTETLEYVQPGVWVSRVKCNPTFMWRVSSCIFDGKIMTNCKPLPGGQTTQLDSTAMDNLHYYYSAVLAKLYLSNDYSLNVTLQPTYASTKLVAYDTTYGVIARSMVSVLTGGIFGTATVPTIGQPSAKVYLVRMPIIIAFVLLLILVLSLIVADVLRASKHHLPFRRMTFLTIASAVRGNWWDREFAKSATLSKTAMRERHKTGVSFGIDRREVGSLGLGPNMSPVDRKKSVTSVDWI